MVKEAYIKGFLYKIAQYGIDPKAIYGDHTLATTDYDLGFESPPLSINSNDKMPVAPTSGSKPGLFQRVLPFIGRFAFNQYNRRHGRPVFLTYSRRF